VMVPFRTWRERKAAPFRHETCWACGWDGDAPIVLDIDQGLVGFECPECETWITYRDMEDD
jgi:predicted RNA-binding Zn-ribbon protein involved in translation (DUF1610 family)